MSRALVPLFRPLAKARIRRGLDGVVVAGLEATRNLMATSPVILVANHVSWWDGLLLFALDESLGARSHVVMDAENLKRLPFFLWTGAIPLDRSSGIRSRRGLVAGAKVLQAPHDALWVFPQGAQRPPHLRPLGLKRGVELLWKAAPVPVIPVALQYVFRERAVPMAIFDFGEPVHTSGALEIGAIEQGLTQGLERIDRYVLGEPLDFVSLMDGPQRRDDDGLATRLLSWALGPSARRRLEIEVDHG